MFEHVYTQVLNLILPPQCGFCKIFLPQPDILCAHCRSRIDPVVSLCMQVTAQYDVTVFAVSAYQDPLKALILSKSYSNIVASNQLGQLMWELTNISQVPFDYIVPIPLHWTRFAKRGFNQAHEMAKVLGTKSGKPVVRLLKRIKMTQFQAALDPRQRLVNVKDAFKLTTVDADQYKDKHLLIVDDLMTTGSTLRAAARELTALKPASITVIVVCRVI